MRANDKMKRTMTNGEVLAEIEAFLELMQEALIQIKADNGVGAYKHLMKSNDMFNVLMTNLTNEFTGYLEEDVKRIKDIRKNN